MNPTDPNSIAGKILLGVIRHFVTGAFAGVVAHGYMTKDQNQQAIGAVMVLLTIGLSAYDKIQSHKQLADAQKGVSA